MIIPAIIIKHKGYDYNLIKQGLVSLNIEYEIIKNYEYYDSNSHLVYCQNIGRISRFWKSGITHILEEPFMVDCKEYIVVNLTYIETINILDKISNMKAFV